MIYSLTMLLACGAPDPVDGTQPVGDPPTTAEEVLDLPVLSIEYPERGSFDSSGSGSVRGSVRSGQTAVSGITINGDYYPVGETGRFDASMGWVPGIQIVGARVEASNGERAIDGRSFYAGPTHEPDSWIENAVRMEIDGEVLDDDDDIPDDVAGLLELALEDTTVIESLIGVPVVTDSAVFTPTQISFGRASIDLSPDTDAIEAQVGIDGIEIDVDIQGVDWYSGVEISATASATSVDTALSMSLESDNGVVRAEVTEVEVALDGFDVAVDWVPEFLEDSLSGWIADYIEGAIAELIEVNLTTFVEETLTAFAVATTFDDDLSMDLRLADISIAPSGIRFEVDARIQAITPVALPRNAGSLTTPGEAPEWPEYKTQPFWAAIDDDLINQLGFAFWSTDLVRNVEFDGVLLGGLTGAPLPAPLGPSDTVVMSLNLPPVLSPTLDEDWAAQLSIGEWNVTFNRTDGETLQFSINFRAHVNAEVDEDGAIRVAIDNRPAQIEQAIGVLEAPDALDPGDLAALVKLLVPPLLGNTSQFAPDIPIPELPLDEFIDVEATQGKILVVEDPAIKLEDNGWLLLQAGLGVY